MSRRSVFDDIVDSFRNGQRRQAIQQAADAAFDGGDLCDLMTYCSDCLDDVELSLDVGRTFLRDRCK